MPLLKSRKRSVAIVSGYGATFTGAFLQAVARQ